MPVKKQVVAFSLREVAEKAATILIFVIINPSIMAGHPDSVNTLWTSALVPEGELPSRMRK